MSNYFTIQGHLQEQFYKFPKLLLTEGKYRELSSNAKLLYMVLTDRNEISILNEWIDSDGKIFFYADQEKMMEILNIKGKDTIAKCFKELRNCELLESVRQGQGKPNKNYLLKPVSVMDSLKYENHTSRSSEIILLEVQKSYGNKTELNNTKNNIYKQDKLAKEVVESKNIFKHNDIVELWNSKCKRGRCNKVTKDIEKLINNRVKEYGKEEVIIAINNYYRVCEDNSYFYNSFFNITGFFKQKNSLPEFTREGQRWIDYSIKKNIPSDEISCSTEYKKPVELSEGSKKAENLKKRLGL